MDLPGDEPCRDRQVKPDTPTLITGTNLSLSNLMAYQQQQQANQQNNGTLGALAGLRAFPTLLSVPPVVLVSNLNEEVRN